MENSIQLPLKVLRDTKVNIYAKMSLIFTPIIFFFGFLIAKHSSFTVFGYPYDHDWLAVSFMPLVMIVICIFGFEKSSELVIDKNEITIKPLPILGIKFGKNQTHKMSEFDSIRIVYSSMREGAKGNRFGYILVYKTGSAYQAFDYPKMPRLSIPDRSEVEQYGKQLAALLGLKVAE